MGHLNEGSTHHVIARRRNLAVMFGAVALTVVGASPAAAAGIGDRITEWPVATSLAAALIFGVLAIVFASLSRAVRDQKQPAKTSTPSSNGAGPPSEASAAAASPSLDKRSSGAVEPYRRPQVVAKAPVDPALDPSATASPVVDEAPSTDAQAPAPAEAPVFEPAAPEHDPVSAAPPPVPPAAQEPPTTDSHRPASDADPLYPLATCRQFATGLGDDVLQRALKLFQPLGQIGRLDSVQLAEMLDARPASLGGLLTTPLSRRADALGLPLPYVIDRVPGTRRRVWRDHADIADRMAAALREEIAVRERSGVHSEREQSSPNGEAANDQMVGRS